MEAGDSAYDLEARDGCSCFYNWSSAVISDTLWDVHGPGQEVYAGGDNSSDEVIKQPEHHWYPCTEHQ